MITLKLHVSSSTTCNLTVHQILTFCQTIYLYASNNTLYIVGLCQCSLNRQLEGSTDLCIIFYSFSSLNDFITIIISQIVFFFHGIHIDLKIFFSSSPRLDTEVAMKLSLLI